MNSITHGANGVNHSTQDDVISSQQADNELEDIDLNMDELNLFALHAKRQDLEDCGDFSKAQIYQFLKEFNATIPYPISEELFTQETADLLTPPEQVTPPASPATLLADAIASKNVEAIWNNDIIEYLAAIKRLNGVAYGAYKNTIKEAFGKSLNLTDFNLAVKQAERTQVLSETGEKRSVTDVAYQWAMENRDTWAYDEQAQTWRMFDRDWSYWQKQDDKISPLRQYITSALQDASIPVNSNNPISCFRDTAASHLRRKFVQAPNKVNFYNGTLDLATMQLLPHDSADNFTYCLPYGYNPYGRCAMIVRVLRSIIGEFHEGQFITNEYAVQALMAHIGLALIGDTYIHKALMALGIAGSGKTTLLDLVNMACGIPPKHFVPHDVFSRELEGKRSRWSHNQKRVACIDEIPADAFEDEETVKQMIGHSGVSMRGLNKDEKEDNQWMPKIFAVGNDDPHYKDISGAIKRRLIVIRCPVQRYEDPTEGQTGQDLFLLKKLETELGAFAAMCIRLALTVRERGGSYPQSGSMKRDLDQLATAGNPLKACLAEKFMTDSTAHTYTRELHAVYEQFCNNEMGKNCKPLGSPKFASALCGMGIGITAKKKSGQRALLGIRLRDEGEAIPGEATYQDGALLIDAGRLDGWDGCWTAGSVGRPHDKLASQAISQEQWTAGTANSEKVITHKDSSISHDAVIHTSIEKDNFVVLPSQPSTDNAAWLVAPVRMVDGPKKQPSNRPQMHLCSQCGSHNVTHIEGAYGPYYCEKCYQKAKPQGIWSS